MGKLRQWVHNHRTSQPGNHLSSNHILLGWPIVNPYIYRALVVDNVDPEGFGRVRLQVPQVLGNTLTGWAFPIPAKGGAIPEIGEQVFAAFEGGSTSHPLYFTSTA